MRVSVCVCAWPLISIESNLYFGSYIPHAILCAFFSNLTLPSTNHVEQFQIINQNKKLNERRNYYRSNLEFWSYWRWPVNLMAASVFSAKNVEIARRIEISIHWFCNFKRKNLRKICHFTLKEKWRKAKYARYKVESTTADIALKLCVRFEVRGRWFGHFGWTFLRAEWFVLSK